MNLNEDWYQTVKNFGIKEITENFGKKDRIGQWIGHGSSGFVYKDSIGILAVKEATITSDDDICIKHFINEVSFGTKF